MTCPHAALRSASLAGCCPLCERPNLRPNGSLRVELGGYLVSVQWSAGDRWRFTISRNGDQIARATRPFPSREAALDAARAYVEVMP